MESDDLSILRKKEEHLSEWLHRYGMAGDIVPDVQRNHDITLWEIGVLENRPTVAGKIPPHLHDSIAQDYELTRLALPMMPGYDQSIIHTASSATISGAMETYNFVAKLADSRDFKATVFSTEQTNLYRKIQAEQERPKQVRSLMQVFCGVKTLQRFDIATKTYLSSKSGAGTRMEAATAIRNTLDGLKGDLFEKARTTLNENMTWVTMSQRLAKGVEEGEVLARNETIRTSLISGLSEILKDRDHGSTTNLDNLWTQALDFIYAVLNLLKPIP